jgi:hypothetical protein
MLYGDHRALQALNGAAAANGSALGGAADEKDKPRGLACVTTRDGRLHVNATFSATVSKWKVVFLVCALLFVGAYLAGPAGGFTEENALRRRVRELETKLSNRVQWVIQHQSHLGQHLQGRGEPGLAGDAAASSPGQPGVHPDGRKHLLVAPGSPSRLAQALAPNTQLAEFDDHYLCGETPVTEAEVVRKTVAIAAVSWRAPQSLRNSMQTWEKNGLLDVVDEKMLFLNSPSQTDVKIAQQFDFDVYTTDERQGNVMAGPALAYLVGNSTADYILFMEKDFELTADKDTMMREMYTGIQHLARGVDVYRCVAWRGCPLRVRVFACLVGVLRCGAART